MTSKRSASESALVPSVDCAPSLLPEINPHPVLVLTSAGSCEFANAAAQELSRLCGLKSLEQLLPSNRKDLCTLVIQEKRNHQAEHRLPGPRILSWVFTPSRTPGQVACFGTDATALVRCESALEEMQRFELIARASASIAHDFNNYLNVFAVSCELLVANEALSDVGKETLTTAASSVQGAANLVKRLRSFGRHHQMQTERVNLAEFTQQVQSVCSLFLSRLVEVTVEPSPEVFALVDREQLEQAVLNILINAKDATENCVRPSIFIRSALESVETGPPWWVLQIEDNGHGMDENTRSKVFEPFFTTKGEGKGTGLGLATAYSVITRLQGKIFIQSQPGQGTTFSIWLPTIP